MKQKPLLLLQQSGRWVWRNMSAKQTESHLTVISSLVIRLIGLSLLVFACLLTWKLIKDDGYSLEAFTVPKTLEENGYSGTYMAVHVQDALLELKKQTVTIKADSLQVGTAAENDFNVNVMGLDLSIRSIAHQIQVLFGRPVKTIQGEITRSGEQLHLTLRVSGFSPVSLNQTIYGGDLDAATKGLCKQGAEALLGMTDPYRLAIVCYREKRYDYAIELVRRILRERPHERTWAYIAWGSILEEQRQLDMAISKYQRATELDSTFALAWTRWGSCLMQQQKSEEAHEKYKIALKYDPDNVNLWLSLGWMYLRSGEKALANDAFNQAIRYASNTDLTTFVSCAEGKMNLDSPEVALQLVQKAVNIGGETAYGYLARTVLASMKNDSVGIITNGLYASELDPSNFFGSKMAMSCALYQKNYQKVIEIGQNVHMGTNERYHAPQFHNLMAVSYSSLGKYDSAFAHIHRAIAADSTVGYLQATLGEIYYLTGKEALFYEKLEKSLKMGMPVRAIGMDDEPYKRVRNHPRFQQLIAKYGK